MDFSQIDYSQIIINTINKLFSTLFASIDKTLYSMLDKVIFIDSSFFNDSFFKNVFGSNKSVGIIMIANSFLIAFFLYYSIKLFFSNYSVSQAEPPRKFLFRFLIIAIIVNFSPFICEKLIYLNSLLCEAIRLIGKNIFNSELSFSCLVEKLNNFIYKNSNNFTLFSFDGIIKSFISIVLLNLLLSYSLRYILIKFFVLISLFAFLSLSNLETCWFFKSWLKNFISLLLVQCFISFVLLIIFALDNSFSSNFSQLMYFSAIYLLTKLNYYIKDLIGGINTEIHLTISSINNLLK